MFCAWIQTVVFERGPLQIAFLDEESRDRLIAVTQVAMGRFVKLQGNPEAYDQEAAELATIGGAILL